MTPTRTCSMPIRRRCWASRAVARRKHRCAILNCGCCGGGVTGAGGPVTAQGYYHFRPADGLFTTTAEHSGALPGSSLLQLAAGQLQSVRELADARKVLAAALEHCLEGRPIVTRAIARACVGTALVPAPAAGTSKA